MRALRGLGSRRYRGMICVLAFSSFATACRKHPSPAASIPPLPRPALQRPAKSRRPQTASNSASAPGSTAPAGSGAGQLPSVPAAEAPRLGQILSPAEERQYNGLIDQSLRRAQSNLILLRSRRLTPEQQSGVREIQEFMRQANQARTVDLMTAKGLADKAEVLAADLVRDSK